MKKNKKSIISVGILTILLAACAKSEIYIDYEEGMAVPYPTATYLSEIVNESDNESNQNSHPQIQGMLTSVTYGSNKIYLFGALHVGRHSWQRLDDIVEDAIANTDVFVFREDPRAGLPYAERIQALWRLDEEISLHDIVPTEVMENLADLIATYRRFPHASLPTMKPITVVDEFWFEAFRLNGATIVSSGVNVIGRRATDMGAPIIGLLNNLETAELFASLSMELQITALSYIQDLFFYQLLAWEVISAYEDNDVAALSQYFQRYDIEVIRADFENEIISEAQFLLAQGMHEIETVYRKRLSYAIAELLRDTEEPTTFFLTIRMSDLFNDRTIFRDVEEMGATITELFH